MKRSNKRNRGFTLVEILIVVVILGILAAIVVPQFTNAADDARTGNLDTQISTIEQQIELFRARTGAYPTFDATLWTTLVTGGYLKTAPVNPINGGSDVGADGSGASWEIYTDANGNAVVESGV
ncbi:MAG: type II secretion system protein [Phycisphaerales bacterium JB037]